MLEDLKQLDRAAKAGAEADVVATAATLKAPARNIQRRTRKLSEIFFSPYKGRSPLVKYILVYSSVWTPQCLVQK